MKKIDFQKIKGTILDIGKYWKKPREGEYVSYKEFLYFVLGAGAANTATYAGSNIGFSAGCLFVGAIYGLKMMDFVMLGFVNLVLNYLFQPISMIITDNLGRPPKKTMRLIHIANSCFIVLGLACFFIPHEPFEGFMPALPQVIGGRLAVQGFGNYWNIFVLSRFSPRFGKYRCWTVANIIPYVLTLLALTWFPYNNFEYHQKFWIMSLCFNVLNCFTSWYGQVTNVQNVISPNTNERTRIMSIGSLLYSLVPSIYNVVFPICAAWAGGMTSIKTYRIVIPAVIIVMAPLSLFLVFGVKDKVVQEENHKPQIDMRHGFAQVLKNKYLWITNISTWITNFSAGSIAIVNMLIIYSMRKDYFIGIFQTIIGTAWTPGMLLAPLLIKKLGKKRLMLISKYTIVLCSFISVAGVYLHSFTIIMVSTYISTILTSVVSIVGYAITADIWDYQQYISGERLDGCMGIFAYISSPITTFGALLVPYLYGRIGFSSDWNILYNQEIRDKIFLISIVVGAITGLLAVLPYHFYDFTEERHEEMMEEIRLREGIKTAEEQEDLSRDSVTVAKEEA